MRLIGVEAAGEGLRRPPRRTARPGLAGRAARLVQLPAAGRRGQVAEAHSISAGLDYPGVGPEHSWLKDSGRAEYAAATDEEALAAFRTLSELEGIIPALESAHAVAYVLRGPIAAPSRPPRRRRRPAASPSRARPPRSTPASTRFARGDLVIVNLSGRGDKDVLRGGRAAGGAVVSVRKLPHGRTSRASARHGARGPAPRIARRRELPPPAHPRLAPRLARAFAAPRAGRAALIPYLTGGHPDLETSDRLIATLIDAGADIVELGVPFSDPIADGPVVQQSTHAALLAGVTPDDVLGLAAAHSAGAPFVLLTYLNSRAGLRARAILRARRRPPAWKRW